MIVSLSAVAGTITWCCWKDMVKLLPTNSRAVTDPKYSNQKFENELAR